MGGRRVVIAVVAVLGLLLVGTIAWANQARPVRYVNLGDSYSSGAGINPVAAGTAPACSQSQLNWAHDLASDRGYELTDVSCSGAQTRHFRTSQGAGVAPQLDALTADTDLVTLTIGGNDNDVFITAFGQCAQLGFQSGGRGNPCEQRFGTRFVDQVRASTYPNVVQALRDVRERAPKARVAISGYLQILSPQGCFPVMPIAAGDVGYLNDLQATLNDAVRRAAAETGATYLDVTPLSTGHDSCQLPGQRWVEPLVPVNAAPVHPNASGERGMAENAIAQLGLQAS
ncbi:SGNH/GDSL hydrolase family protein [Actinomycetospora termitidis]|uniref:SGNH/GDSL hydrolase family protein n=1 Tax=Actinomycetospora termitidis TaxID=3053470 RepID=A0ABT7M7N0_9PSEU|nr:SGNH/GDSL hydrolase family protein [Actinomycetospora sp. Odt1-22]MDL5156676.1 SGNH/GDSL hydrolase family protein [Actinomycetospora sp. Odt1-22]